MTQNSLYILVQQGDDLALRKRRDDLVAESGVPNAVVQRINLEEDEPAHIVQAASAPDLFGGRRCMVVEHFELFPADFVNELAEALKITDAVIVAIVTKAPTKKTLQAYGEHCSIERFAEPKGQNVAGRIIEIAAQNGVELSQRHARQIARDGIDDYATVNDAFSKIADLGQTSVKDDQLAEIESIVRGAPMPWDLSDAVERGDIKSAFQVMERQTVSPFATFAYISGRIRDFSIIKESGETTPAGVQTLLGLRHPFPAKKLLEASRKIKDADVPQLWELVAENDRRMRTENDDRQIVAEFVISVTRVFQKR